MTGNTRIAQNPFISLINAEGLVCKRDFRKQISQVIVLKEL